MPDTTRSRLTRRQAVAVGGATAAEYALSVDTVRAQARNRHLRTARRRLSVKTGDYQMPVYEARPSSGGPAPAILVISEI